MITLEELQHSSTKHTLQKYWDGYKKMYGQDPEARRHPATIHSRVLTCEEVNQFYTDLRAEYVMPEQDVLALGNNARRLQMLAHGITIVSNDDHFFLTDDCQFGWEILRAKGMISVTYPGLPYMVAARPKFPDGVLRTAEDLITIFECGNTQLKSDQELLDYLNS